jgi:hypothetical protein
MGLFVEGPVGDCDSARAMLGGGEFGSEMSTFELEDVSDDIRSSVSNGFSSSNVSMEALSVCARRRNDVLRRQGLGLSASLNSEGKLGEEETHLRC